MKNIRVWARAHFLASFAKQVQLFSSTTAITTASPRTLRRAVPSVFVGLGADSSFGACSPDEMSETLARSTRRHLAPAGTDGACRRTLQNRRDRPVAVVVVVAVIWTTRCLWIEGGAWRGAIFWWAGRQVMRRPSPSFIIFIGWSVVFQDE